jgi:cation transport ATPase
LAEEKNKYGITVESSNLSKMLAVFVLSCKAKRKRAFNLVFACLYNTAVFVGVGTIGVIFALPFLPIICASAMVISTIIIVLNSQVLFSRNL